MNKTAKALVAASVAGMLAASMSGCGVKADVDVSVADKTIGGMGQLYITDSERDTAQNLLNTLSLFSASLSEEGKEGFEKVKSLLATLQEETLDDGQVMLSGDGLKLDSRIFEEDEDAADEDFEEDVDAEDEGFEEDADDPDALDEDGAADEDAEGVEPGPIVLGEDDFAGSGIIFDDDKLVINGLNIGEDIDLDNAAALAGAGDLGDLGSLETLLGGMDLPKIETAEDLLKLINYYKVTMNFDVTPVETNGTPEGNTVTYGLDDLAKEQYYVTFAPGVLDRTDIEPVTANKAYTKKSVVAFNTTGILESIAVNKQAPASPVCIDLDSGEVRTNAALLAKQGKNTVEVAFANGHSKTFTYYYDTKKPTASVKKNKAYKNGTKVTVKDAQALKSVTLDGKKVKVSGKKAVTKKITKKGTHKIVATDKAGNKLTVKFKIKKK